MEGAGADPLAPAEANGEGEDAPADANGEEALAVKGDGFEEKLANEAWGFFAGGMGAETATGTTDPVVVLAACPSAMP